MREVTLKLIAGIPKMIFAGQEIHRLIEEIDNIVADINVKLIDFKQ